MSAIRSLIRLGAELAIGAIEGIKPDPLEIARELMLIAVDTGVAAAQLREYLDDAARARGEEAFSEAKREKFGAPP